MSGSREAGAAKTARTLVDVLAHWATTKPDAIAYTYLVDGEREERSLTFAETDRAARAVATTLRERLGDTAERPTALLLYAPGLEFIPAFLGCLYAGVVAVPVNPPRSGKHLERLAAVSRDSGARIALTSESNLPAITAFFRDSGELSGVPVLATDRLDTGGDPAPLPDEDTTAFIQYTSGSTGTPRGVIVSHANLMANLAGVKRVYGGVPVPILVSWLPIFHDMGLIGCTLTTLFRGDREVFMSPLSFLERPVRWLEAITRYRAAETEAPNFAYELAVRKVREKDRAALDLSSLQIAWCGAEPIRADTMRRFEAAFSGCGYRPSIFVSCYGLAEGTLLVSSSMPGRPPTILPVDPDALEQKVVRAPRGDNRREIVSCGTSHDDTRIAIVDPDSHRELAEDHVGEIWLRGPSVARGYWRRPAETAEIFGARLTSGTGDDGPFLRTGDIGFWHRGELYVTGRSKDVIIVRGRNLYPQDIETTVERVVPFARANAVAAFAEERSGTESVVVAIETPNGIATDQLAALHLAVEGALTAEFEAPVSAVVFVKAVPRTTSGKVRRSDCRTRYVAGDLEIVFPLPSVRPVIEEALRAWMLEERGRTLGAIDPDVPIPELGIDSLGVASIAADLCDRLGRNISADALYQHQTVRRLAEYLDRVVTTARPDPWHRYHELNQRAEAWKESGDYYFGQEITAQSAARVVIDGKDMLVMGSYSYLGLLKHEALRAASVQAIEEFGTGHHGVRLLAGTSVLHRKLERALAEVHEAEDAIVFTSGFVTNVATISSLVGPGDVVISDEWNHASLVDGCRSSGAEMLTYRHQDMNHLDRLLTQAGSRHTLVVVDGVFSMEGDIVDLPAVVERCRKHGALLMVDEAHSFGVLGRRGRGVLEHFGLPGDAIDVKMGTLSKALGSSGGYIAGSDTLVRYLRHHARGYVFSGALPNAEIAAALAALKVLEDEPERLVRLWHNRERFMKGITALGFRTFGSETPIVPIATRSERETLAMVRFCRDHGLFVVPIFYPAVPRDAPRLRTCVMASHTDEDIDFAIDVLGRAAAHVR